MKTALTLAMAGLLSLANFAQAQTATKVTITFHTTDDDKDGDTQVQDRIMIGGNEVAELFCCSVHANGDTFGNNSVTSRDMQITQSFSKADLRSGASLVLGMTPHGNDNWHFVPSLDIQFSDGTSRHWAFDQVELDSLGSAASQTVRFSTNP